LFAAGGAESRRWIDGESVRVGTTFGDVVAGATHDAGPFVARDGHDEAHVGAADAARKVAALDVEEVAGLGVGGPCALMVEV
jgi:hypothetical protein